MTVQYIITRFKKHGYKVSRSLNSGNIVVTTRRGFTYYYKSYHAAYNCMLVGTMWFSNL